MTDAVGTDPLPENVDGQIVESHEFVHRVDHEINWSVIGVLAVGLLVAYYLVRTDTGAEVEDEARERLNR